MLDRETIDAMRNQLKSGVAVVSGPQLFPTPKGLCEKMINQVTILPSHRILEPSAGTGNIINAIGQHEFITGVEIDRNLSDSLAARLPHVKIINDDFLNLNSYLIGLFDKIFMNPPFKNGQDIKHILHAYRLLHDDGVLVAILSEGPFFRSDYQSSQFRNFLNSHTVDIEKLPSNSFKDSGTSVNTRMITIYK